MARTLLDRFNEKYIPVTESGCWLWTANTTEDGYGLIRRNSEQLIQAHRCSWELFRGPIPEEFWVLHCCDVRCCVNPYHLFLGTALDNERDKISKGRARHWRQRDDMSVCVRGHSDHWYFEKSGARKCRLCKRENDRARKARICLT